VCLCAFHPEISSFYRQEFPLSFPIFVLSLLQYFTFHVVSNRLVLLVESYTFLPLFTPLSPCLDFRVFYCVCFKNYSLFILCFAYNFNANIIIVANLIDSFIG
jgi:hypothetical protein